MRDDFILPLFVSEKISERDRFQSMPGVSPIFARRDRGSKRLARMLPGFRPSFCLGFRQIRMNKRVALTLTTALFNAP